MVDLQIKGMREAVSSLQGLMRKPIARDELLSYAPLKMVSSSTLCESSSTPSQLQTTQNLVMGAISGFASVVDERLQTIQAQLDQKDDALQPLTEASSAAQSEENTRAMLQVKSVLDYLRRPSCSDSQIPQSVNLSNAESPSDGQWQTIFNEVDRVVSKVQTAVTSTLAPRPLRADAPEFNPHASVTTEAKSSLLNATSTDQSIATAQLVAEMISTRDRGQIRQYDFGQSRGKSAPEPKRPPNAFQLFV